jgi:hypothetical protein
MAKNFNDRCKEEQKVALHGETLTEFNSRGSSLFYDPDYGFFKCNYYNFIKGNSKHPSRREYNHNTKRFKKTLSEGCQLLKDAGVNNVLLIEWDGLMTSSATFKDVDYGVFEKEFRQVLRKKANHPDRTKENKSRSSKEKWKKESYRDLVISKIKNSSHESNKKRAKTMLSKYGIQHALQNSVFKSKQEETNLKKYGKPHYAQTDVFLKNHSKVNPFKFSAQTVYEGRIKSGSIKTFSGKTMSEYAQNMGKAYTTFQSQVKKYGIDFALNIQSHTSGLEAVMMKILNNLNCEYEHQFRVDNYIADFKVDNLLIEVDGLFWHSDYNIKNKNYHKKLQIIKRNIFSVQFLLID